jgi:lipopolysaccharide transport system permease protein
MDFFFGFVVLLGLMVYYKLPIGLNILWLAPLVLLTLLAALSVSLWLSALNVQYRDVQHMVPFLIQAWMYASPVAYSLDVVSGTGIWQVVYALNPMVGVIQGFRWVLLGSTPPGPYLWISVAMVAVLLVSGLYYFRHMERTFADMV